MLAHMMRSSSRAWFLALIMVVLVAVTAEAASVTPTVIPGAANTDKTCDVVMPGTLELKVDNGTAGTYTSGDGTLTATIVQPSTLAGSLNSVDWSSNIPVVGVIVKDGVDGANWYNYGAPGSMGDTYLTTPIGGAKGISHVSFCYYPYYPLTATKTAAGTYDRTVTWDLAKSVDPANHTGYAGQNAGSSKWTVTATKHEESSNFSVAGEITIYNPNTFAVGFEVGDVLSDGTAAAVTCPAPTLGAKSSVVCKYTALPSSVAANKNTAVVKSLYTGKAEATAEAAISWSEHLLGYDSGQLTDARFSYSQPIAKSTTLEFPEDFPCPADPSLYVAGKYQYKVTNTAVLDGGIGKSASADVTVTCYLPALKVEKTAAGTYDRTITWELKKTVEPGALTGFAGQKAGSVTWKVEATKEETLGSYQVVGKIKITNPAAVDQAFTVGDVLDDGTPAAVSCPANTVPAGGTLECTYTASPSGATATENKATVSAAGNADQVATATINWTENVKGYKQGVLSDGRFQYEATIDSSTTKAFEETFSCSADSSLYKDGVYQYTVVNEALLDGGINLSASAKVVVTCFAPVVRKDANPSLTRTWTWTIDKVGDQTSATLAVGQPFLVNYEVTVNATAKDSGFAVAGTIYVHNPAAAAMTVDVSDKLSDGAVATVDCGSGSTSLTVLAGETGTCSYTAALADASPRTNTATASLKSAAFTGTADVDFAKATIHEIDECIDVVDDKYGALGAVCANAQPKMFKYAMDAGSYATCGTYRFDNTAAFTTKDTGAAGSDSWSVAVTVPCPGCTLTQGYWKTHSSHGPAPYDDGWLKIGPAGADTVFFKSGKSWYDVFWTPPAGNVYYNLAHQYMAAKLNILNGASSTAAVDAAILGAEGFFSTRTPGATLSKQERTQVLKWASTLDEYNNGSIGPGHCSEDAYSVRSLGISLEPGLYLPAITK
jgi:hypothetical protein